MTTRQHPATPNTLDSNFTMRQTVYTERGKGNLGADVYELWRHRGLLLTWTKREIQVRYKQSFLGGVWAILQPLSIMVLFSIVFTRFLRVPTGNIPYPIFSYAALIPWTFFANSISFGMPSIVTNMNLVTKIYFPREILPIAAIMACLVDSLVASVVFVGMLFVYQVQVHSTLVLLPLLLAIQVMLTIGLVLLASAVNVRYRDVRFVMPLVMQLWMYATPIIYPLSMVPKHWRTLYMLNPMAGLVESYRATILQGAWPNWQHVWAAAAISGIVFVSGYLYFKQTEWQFADII